MKEYGGFLEWEHYKNLEFHDKAIKLNSGRNCLLYLIKLYDIKEIYMPFYNCSAVFEPCVKENVIIRYYNIGRDFLPILPKSVSDDSWIYIVNYYGQISNSFISNLSKSYKNLIIDNAQAFFQTPIDGIPTIYTCRKYFGVPDGSYLYLKKDSDKKIKLELDKSGERLQHLIGRYEENANKYYLSYQENENRIENLDLKEMSKFTQNLLKSIDYDKVMLTRENNFNKLNELLGEKNKIKCKNVKGPFMYPFYNKNGYSIRKKLNNLKIYVPILWPNVLDETNSNAIEHKFAENILPLPCDQRYNESDMEYIAKIILKILEDKK